MIDPVTLIALLGPLIKSGGQALINKFSGDFKPQTASDVIALMEAETKALIARKDVADTAEPSYKWVAALIKLQRPTVVYGTGAVFVIMSVFGLGDEFSRRAVGDMAAICIYWLFGERTMLALKK